jgi:hypothetical protein
MILNFIIDVPFVPNSEHSYCFLFFFFINGLIELNFYDCVLCACVSGC